jgi:phenylacetate-CoA ligase
MARHVHTAIDSLTSFSRVEGRKQDYVVTANGNYITLTGLIFAQHFHAFGQIRNMQLYQDTLGEVIVRVVPSGEFSREDVKEIETTMAAAVGGGLVPRVQIVDDIPRTQRGKYRFLEQKLDVRYRE